MTATSPIRIFRIGSAPVPVMQEANCHIAAKQMQSREIVIMAATVSVDRPGRGPLAGMVSEVASGPPGVLHIQLNLPDN